MKERTYTEMEMNDLCAREYRRGRQHGADDAVKDTMTLLREIHKRLHLEDHVLRGTEKDSDESI